MCFFFFFGSSIGTGCIKYHENLYFGFANNNINSAVFTVRKNGIVDTGDSVEEVFSLTIKVSPVEKEQISCFRTISTVTYGFSTIFDIVS